MANHEAADSSAKGNHKSIVIHIDRAEFKVTSEAMIGAELRQLPTPPIGPDHDLYLELPGPEDDELIADDRSVELKNGMHFFTAPHAITPG